MVEFKAYGGRALRIAVGMIVLVLVMAGEAGATKIVRNDATGGDCTSFGTWNAATMTCTMTTDIAEGIRVDGNGVTLDGNGHTITGNGGGGTVGVFLSGRSGVTIKNINTKNNAIGINLVSSNNNILSGNNATSNSNSGIALSSSSNNILSNNNASSNDGYGISMGNSNNNILSSNNFSNERIGIYMSGSNYNTLNSNDASNNMAYGYSSIYLTSSINNTLSGNNASNNSGGGIYLSQSSNSMLSGNNASNNDFGIYLYTSSDNMVNGNTANSNKGVGISVPYASNNNTLSNNNANSNNGDGIYLIASNNMLSNNNANSNNNYGIHLYAGSNNMLSNNNANSNNLYYGIYLDRTNNNTLSGNNASKNNYGIYLSNSRDNTLKGNNVNSNYNTGIYLYCNPAYSFSNNIYNNYFNNTINYGSSTGNATWNTSKTSAANIIGGPYLGGNFWANPGSTGFSQTCPDADGDGLCNSIYTLDSYNIDYLPLSLNFSIDNISPASITNLTNITYAPTYINWIWTNPSNPDFNHTEIYLNGIFITNIPAPQNQYNATGLLPGTSYTLGTHTVDKSGNVNETWVNDTASTLPTSGTTLNLYTGWNLISFPLMPEDTSTALVLSSLGGNYSIVWEYDTSDTADHWKKYDPGAPFGNDLLNMKPGKGYWIMMISDDALTVSGTVPESTDIELMTGWNLIGYNSFDGQPIVEVLSSISGNYSIVWEYDTSDTADHWKKYDPSAPFGNDLANMEAGKGYWIMMTTDDILEI